jgi:type IV secretion system protein VirB8
MDKHHQKATENLTDTIRSGEYFNQARKWYFVLFSNPITERTFYLFTFLVALVTLVIAIASVAYILPVTKVYPFYLRNNKPDTQIPQIIKLRQNSSETQDFALMRFFVATYVKYRESYSLDKFELSDKVVSNYSDQPTLQGYRQLMDTSNPSSPRLLFRDPWMMRIAEPTGVTLKLDTQPYQALVYFDVTVRGNNQGEVVPFTADIRFLYSPLQPVTELDSVTGKTVTRFKQPEFQVVSYNVQQSAAQTANPGYQQVR